MRRKDREVTDPIKILQIIDSCDTCRLGLVDGKRAYVVPLSFGYTYIEGHYTFYFHCAMEGRKLALIRESESIAFQMDSGHAVSPSGGSYTMLYRSVCGYGKPVFIEKAEEKRMALRHLTAHYVSDDQTEYSDQLLEKTFVFRLEVEELTCKENR